MSDNVFTPQHTARINSERFETELGAVWYAANYYYQTSYKRGREYIGVVFRDTDGKYGITVRGDGGFAASKVRIGDVPPGTLPTAVWHTHIPSSAGGLSTAGRIVMLLLTSFDMDWDEFSDADKKLSDDASKVSLKRWGHSISIYLLTDTKIKRYQGPHYVEKTWRKDRPSKMR